MWTWSPDICVLRVLCKYLSAMGSYTKANCIHSSRLHEKNIPNPGGHTGFGKDQHPSCSQGNCNGCSETSIWHQTVQSCGADLQEGNWLPVKWMLEEFYKSLCQATSFCRSIECLTIITFLWIKNLLPSKALFITTGLMMNVALRLSAPELKNRPYWQLTA